MFTFGAFDAAAAAGLTAVLQSWPSLPGLAVTTVDVPGVDGSFFAAQSLGTGSFVFDLWASASTPAGVLAIAGQVAAALAPGAGLQSLGVDVAPGWVWYAVAADEVRWERGVWEPGSLCVLKASVTFECPDPYGYASPDETANGASGATITRAKGNVSSFPRIEISGAFTGVHVVVGSASLDVDVEVGAGQKLVLDYAQLDFAVWNAAGTLKLAHAAPGMSTFDRVTLPLGPTVVSAAAGAGAVSNVLILANSRRA